MQNLKGKCDKRRVMKESMVDLVGEENRREGGKNEFDEDDKSIYCGAVTT